ncbi:hypothetical protein RCIP0012_00204 [Klebsiella phage RCIP0012]
MGYFQMSRNVEEIFGGVVVAPHQIPFKYTSTNGGETFLSLPFYPITGFVTINSGVQVPIDNFEIDGNTLNLGRELEAGDVVFCLFDKIMSPQDASNNAIRIYKFLSVGGETEFTPDFTAYGVQSLFIDGRYKVPGEDYNYFKTSNKVVLDNALATEVWVVAEMNIKQNIPALAGNDGASQIGTSTGATVETRLTTLDSEVDPTLRQNLGSGEEGLGISLNALEQGGNGQHLAVFVSPQMRHSDPYNNFGTAVKDAFATAMAMGIGEVRVPSGIYVLDSTVTVTLSMSMSLIFDPGVIIYVDSPLSAFNFNINGKHLNIVGNNARVMSRWGSLSGSGTVAFKFTDATLDKSLTASNLKVGTADGTSKFQYSAYGTGLNLATFTDCVLQSTYGIYLESVLLNGTSYHAMGNHIDKCKVYTDDYCLKVGNQGALGCEGFVVTGGEFVTSTTAFIIDNIGLSSSAYLPPLFRFEGIHISAYRALYAKDISRLFFVDVDIQVKSNPSVTGTYKGVIELGGVQQFHHDVVSYSSVPLNGATGADMIPAIYQFASTLTNAFFTSNGNIYQLDAMTAPVFDFSGTTNVTEIQVSNDRLISSGTWVSNAYLAYVRLSPELTVGNTGAAAGLDYSTKGSFSSGVLSLGTRPSQGFTYSIPASILANGSTISQIIFPSQMVGKEVNIMLAAANVSFTHGTNMICPDQKPFLMPFPNAVRVFALNTTQCLILGVGGMLNRHNDITTAPTTQLSSGYDGAEYFDSVNDRLLMRRNGVWFYIPVTRLPAS